ncbi:MAG: phasin family protein [Steroidobacteraceae bacterium]
MAARRKKTRAGTTTRRGGRKAAEARGNVLESVQQVWLAGMGAIARAQKEGPGAFQDAVREGFDLLNKSRSTTEKMIRDVFESAQESVQTRLDTAREQATETWDNIEALFQSRVHKALQQMGVPSPEEIRLLTRRVAELNDNVKALAAGQARAAARKSKAPVRKPARRKTARAAS